LSDDELKNWTQEIDGLNGALSFEERQNLFNQIAEGMDATQMTRFVQTFDGSPLGRGALADAVAGHGSTEAKAGFIEATKGDIHGEYNARQGNWGNAQTAAIGTVLANLGDNPAAFERAVGSLGKEQLQDVMAVAMGRRYIADFSGMTAGGTGYDPSALIDILKAAEGSGLTTRTKVFEAAMPQLKTMQGDSGAKSSVDGVAQAMGRVLSREEAAKAGLVNTPEAPPGVSMDTNIAEAQKHGFPQDLPWFYNQVRNGAIWDYKQIDPEKYQDFGNFHYGVVAAAMGIPEDVALRAAGVAQLFAGTSKIEYGLPGVSGAYGDDPKDQQQIGDGYAYYNSGLHRVWPD
jgi:hypothetical protein